MREFAAEIRRLQDYIKSMCRDLPPDDDEAREWTPPDCQLLDQFIASRGEAAFRELVLRHGELVMGVCRRVLRSEHDAEDAFQAAFLVLARGAGRIRKRANLAAWLYGTSYRIARKIRDRRYRRCEMPLCGDVVVTGDALSALAERCDREALDEELHRLPLKYREPLVLHYLLKKTAREISEELGITIRAVEGRLRRGRSELRYRLARRGVSLLVVAGAVQAAHTADAAAAATLVHNTVNAGVKYASGELTGHSASLAAEELSKMTTPGISTSAVAAGLAALLFGVAALSTLPNSAAREVTALHNQLALRSIEAADDFSTFAVADVTDAGTQDTELADSNGTASNDAVESPDEAETSGNGYPGRIYLYVHVGIPQVDGIDHVLGVIGVDPNTGEWEVVSGARAATLSVLADGKFALISVRDRLTDQQQLLLFDMQEKTSQNLGEFFSAIPSRDGKEAIVTQVEFPESDREGLVLATGQKHWRLTLATLEKAPLPIPRDRMIIDATADLEWCLTLSTTIRQGRPKQGIIMIKSDGTEGRPLTVQDDSSHGRACFAPNGERIAFVSYGPDRKPSIRVIDFDGTNERTLYEAKEINQLPESLCWSPDGRSLIAIIGEHAESAPDYRLLILDVHTGAQRELTLENAKVFSLRYPNWR